MKIDRVTKRYGELRSTGYPSFSNTRHETELGAILESGDTAAAVGARLLELAKMEVKKDFGDKDVAQTEMDLPF
jgi:hypothetical protein